MDNAGANPGGQREFGDKGKREPGMDEPPGGENLELIRISILSRAIPDVQPAGFGAFQGANPSGMEEHQISPGLGSLCGLWEVFGIFLALPPGKALEKGKGSTLG